MTRIYTKKGDDGTTSLWYGGRVAKSDPRTEAYGALDEAASALGVARSLCGDPRPSSPPTSSALQDDLFIAGAELATAPEAADRLVDGVSRVTPEMAAELEELIDRYMDRVELPPKFVIPGGSPALGPARSRRARSCAAPSAARSPSTPARGRSRPSCCASSTAPPTPPTRWRALADVDDPELFAGREREQPKA